MNEQVKISVIMPVYNAESVIAKCLDSLLMQTLEDFEIICVDDGSTDTSLFILKEYEKKDARIKVIQQQNSFAGVARNFGMENANGKYLMFLDGDDFFEPDLLKLQYETCEIHQADICICGGDKYNEILDQYETAAYFLRKDFFDDSYSNRIYLKEKIFQVTNPAPWNKIYLSKFIKKNHLKFQTIATTNDLYFTMMAMALAERITYVDKILVHYRVGQSNNLQSTDSGIDRAMDFCIALELLKDKLVVNNLYDELRWAFINKAVSTCKYQLDKQKANQDVYSIICADLWSKYIKKFELDAKPELESMYESWQKDIVSQVYQEYFLCNRNEVLDNPIKVSVIIPVYNVEDYLEECLDSILNQTLKNIEIICINDGSLDNSEIILKKYEACDSRIKVISQENRGLSGARNRGLKEVSGQYVYFMDSDDILELDALEYLYKEAVCNNLDILYFDAITFYENKSLEEQYDTYRSTYSYERIEELSSIYGGYEMMSEFHRIKGYRASVCLQFFLSDFLNKNNLDFCEGILFEDQLFTFTSMLQANRVSHRKKSFFNRRVREGSIMTQQEVTAVQIRGYIVSYIEMLHFAKQLNVPIKYKKGIQISLRNVRNALMNKWKVFEELENYELEDILSKEEFRNVQQILLKEIWDLENLVKSNRKEMKEEIQKVTRNKNNKINTLQKSYETKNNLCKHYKIEICDMKNSVSFRLGRAITFFPRKMVSAINCCKDHGIGYTVKLFFSRILHP